ncbi:hypothetical protein BYT27DRAFT_7250895 [Phlegmacium glaucopus]|nr:hypothetical protein BYT27DRAFT_7250895 [Phlegmacium glaucopus]
MFIFNTSTAFVPLVQVLSRLFSGSVQRQHRCVNLHNFVSGRSGWSFQLSHPRKLEIVLDIDEKNRNVDREVKRLQVPPTIYGDAIDASIDGALKTSLRPSNGIFRAERFISMANHSVSRVQRVVKRAIKVRFLPHRQSEVMLTTTLLGWKRQAMIADLNASLKDDASLGSYHRPLILPQIFSLHVRVQLISVAATLTENDDEDTRIIRRLLLRKIEAQTSGIWDEVDSVTGWLEIVKEVKAYLSTNTEITVRGHFVLPTPPDRDLLLNQHPSGADQVWGPKSPILAHERHLNWLLAKLNQQVDRPVGNLYIPPHRRH